MASIKRENPTSEEQQPNSKRQNFSSVEFDSASSSPRVALNPADCDLAFNIEADGITGSALYEKGFAHCWSGARGNVGITRGKYCFGCKIISEQPVTMDDTPVDKQHLCRVGISKGDDPVGNLGETKHSFGYGGTRKFSNARKFVDYGERFGVGDTIVCCVDLESKPASVEFSKNGKRLGIAKRFDVVTKGLGMIDSPSGKLPWESALFPHVLLKNTVVKMQFSEEDGLVPVEGYKPWNSAVKDGNTVTGPSFADPKDCEVIMMVGLPASGKTTWAEKWVKEHPEKRYIVLGTNLALDQMKVQGLMRKSNYGERFDCLMDRASKIFNTLLSRASKVSQNYVIDQTNVYKSARMRKLKPFNDFHKIAAVVFPRREELKQRAYKRFKEMGKEVPPEAINEMIVNFSLPMSKDMHCSDESFDKVIFTDLSRDEAKQVLNEMQHPLKLTSAVKQKNDYSSRSCESSIHSDSKISSYSLPGVGPPYPGYSSPSLGLHTGSRIGRPEPPLQPNTANVHRGLTGVGQHGALESAQQYSYSHGTPGYGSNAEDARSAYQRPYAVPPYGTPNPRYAAGECHPCPGPYHPPR